MNKCIIIDDEPTAIEGLRKYIHVIPYLQIVAAYTNPVKAILEMASGDPVDIVFLDIDMPGISGIEVSREIRHKTRKLVFTTAHTQYGYSAFEVEADGYLLKPYSLAKFTGLVGKLLNLSAEAEFQDKQKFFFVKSKEHENGLVRGLFSEVIAIESDHNYVTIHMTDGPLKAYMSLTNIAQTFNEQNGFRQFQRSFIISESHIESINGSVISMSNGKRITVGDYYRKSFQDFVSAFLIRADKKP